MLLKTVDLPHFLHRTEKGFLFTEGGKHDPSFWQNYHIYSPQCCFYAFLFYTIKIWHVLLVRVNWTSFKKNYETQTLNGISSPPLPSSFFSSFLHFWKWMANNLFFGIQDKAKYKNSWPWITLLSKGTGKIRGSQRWSSL